MGSRLRAVRAAASRAQRTIPVGRAGPGLTVNLGLLSLTRPGGYRPDLSDRERCRGGSLSLWEAVSVGNGSISVGDYGEAGRVP